MGLDYFMAKVNKGEKASSRTPEGWIHWNFADKTELAYGRKSWELVHMFNTDLQNDCCSPLAKEDYQKFIDAVDQFGIENIEKYHHNLCLLDSNEPAELTSNEFIDLEEEFEKWWDSVFFDFDGHPTLGYDFAAGYIISFYRAKDEVFKAWEDGDEVWTFASY